MTDDIHQLEQAINSLLGGNWKHMEILGNTGKVHVLAATLYGRVTLNYVRTGSDDIQFTIEFVDPQATMEHCVAEQSAPWQLVEGTTLRTYVVILPVAEFYNPLLNAMYMLNTGITQCLINESAPSFTLELLNECATFAEELIRYEQNEDNTPPTPEDLESIKRIQARVEQKLREQQLTDQSSE